MDHGGKALLEISGDFVSIGGNKDTHNRRIGPIDELIDLMMVGVLIVPFSLLSRSPVFCRAALQEKVSCLFALDRFAEQQT